VDVNILLCDAAHEVGGKLYVLGGGWSLLHLPRTPTNMALAMKIEVPWDQTNRAIKIQAALRDADGQDVDIGQGPIVASGDVTVGRPAHVKPGTPIDLPIAMQFNGIALEPGGYVWELEIDGHVEARVGFRVMPGPPGQPQPPSQEPEGGEQE
jgi:hypothetical protein